MKTYRGSDGDQRIWFEVNEIELIMEDELSRAGLLPTLPGEQPIVDIESFIERHLKSSLDQHAELDHLVLGLTEFRPGVMPSVQINKDLTGSAMDAEWCPPGIRGRWRATLAHEAAHIVLHRSLFEVDPAQMTMFAPATSPERLVFRCLKRDVAYRDGTRNWREVQANRGMAALLMPKTLFVAAARDEVTDTSAAGVEAATRRLAARFGVSLEAAAIRLQTLGFRSSDGELFAS